MSFMHASRIGLKFQTSIGLLGVEEVWQLSLKQLDQLAISLHKKLKEENEVSFITDKPATNSCDELRFDIVKQIIAYKLAERAANELERNNTARKQKLLAILESKQEAVLADLSEEEILKELESLK